MTYRLPILVLMLTPLITSCEGGGATGAMMTGSGSITVAGRQASDLTGSWVLASLGDEAPAHGGEAFEMEITDRQFQARIGCRLLGWHYILDETALRSAALAEPAGSCATPLSSRAKAFTTFIDEASVAAVRDDGALVLVADDRLAVFKRPTN